MPGICLHLHLQPLDAINFPLRLTKGAQKTTLVDPNQDVLKHNKPVVCYENSRWTLQGVFFRFETVLDPFSINKQKSTTFPIQIQIHIYIYMYIVFMHFSQSNWRFSFSWNPNFQSLSSSYSSHMRWCKHQNWQHLVLDVPPTRRPHCASRFDTKPWLHWKPPRSGKKTPRKF